MISLLLTAALALPQSTPAPERPWTFLIYGAADNNADGPLLYFVDRVRKSLDDDKGIELVLFIDRSEGYSDDATLLGDDFTGARIYRMKKDAAERVDPGDAFPEIAGDGDDEVDSANPAMLGKFVE